MRIPAILTLLLSITPLPAQNPQQLLVQANQLYQQGKYTGARQAYEAILAQGYESPSLLYNLGNACYKSGDIAHAVLNYERARRFIPDDDDLLHNLQLINLMLIDKIEPAPRLFIWDTWESIQAFFSLNGLTIAGYLLFVAVMGSASAMLLARTYRSRRLWFTGGVVGSALLLLVIVVFAAKVSDLHRLDMAVVTANITTVKNAPDIRSSDAFVIHSGLKVQIIDRVSSWVKIRLADGKVGWMEEAAAEVI